MRKWVFYSVLAAGGFVLPVALVTAEPADPAPTPSEAVEEAPMATPAAEVEALEAAAEESPAEVPDVSSAPPPAPAPSEEYVVQAGDTLGDIAREHLGSIEAWPRIAELNGIVDPEKLAVGTRLKLPAREEHGS